MGTNFSNFETLTDSQRDKAKRLGITDVEMVERLKRIHGLEKPQISIIIPVYNCEKYLRKAIDSALNQNFRNKEVIVVDDGSTDESLDIALEYDNITVLVKPNGGTASALNTGIRNAKGEWIKWLSADDELLPNALDILMDNVTVKEAIYYTNYLRIDEYGNIKSKWIEPNHDVKTLMKFFFGNGSSSLIHKSVFEKCGMFDESLPHSEDYEFWLRCTHLHNIPMILIPYFTLNYREHVDQLTKKVGGSLDHEIKQKVLGQLAKV